MSEHTLISGKIEYLHQPYREKGFTYCKHCKKFCSKLEIQFNEGWLSDWQEVRCGKCHKTIWVVEFKRDERQDKLYSRQKRGSKKTKELDLEGVRRFIKDNKKCEICKKLTNHYDAYSVCYTGMSKKEVHICSKKCNNLFDIKFRKWCKKNVKK